MLPILPNGSTLPQVATWLAEVGAALAPGDGFRYFNLLYQRVTERVVERVADGQVEDAAFVAHLDVRFAELYQAALLTVPGLAPRAWRVMLDRRFDASISPARFAFAGMNAHINRDLTTALITTATDLGIALDRDSARFRDFEAIDDLLAELMAESKQLLFDDLGVTLDEALGPFDDLLEIWSIRAARQHAWRNAALALHLPPGPVREAQLRGVDRTAALVGRLLML